MHFAVSLLNFRPGRIGGAETYLRALIAELPALRGEDRITVLLHRGNADAIDIRGGLERLVLDLSDRSVAVRRYAEALTPWRDRGVERAIERLAPDAILFPQQSLFPKSLEIPSLLTVLDVQHLFFPQYFSLAHRIFRAAIYPLSLRRAGRILAISEFTRRTLIERCGIPPERIETAPLGFSPSRSAAGPSSGLVDFPYFYYPAASFPHKGHLALFRSLAALRGRSGVGDCRLVLTGQKTPYWAVLEREIRRLGLDDMVAHLGFVSADEVARLYRGAAAVLFPSEYEGFGLPVVEAAAFGRPIIASRLAVFDEIGLPARCQIDFSDPDQLEVALQSLEPIRLSRSPFTWRQHTEATLQMLRRMVSAAPFRPKR